MYGTKVGVGVKGIAVGVTGVALLKGVAVARGIVAAAVTCPAVLCWGDTHAGTMARITRTLKEERKRFTVYLLCCKGESAVKATSV
jgi:hypothetical protein